MCMLVFCKNFRSPHTPGLDLEGPSILVRSKLNSQPRLCQLKLYASAAQLQRGGKPSVKQSLPESDGFDQPARQPSSDSPAAKRRARSTKKRGSEKPVGPPSGRQRLAKVLAAAGVASRRAAEDLIFDGQVTVNGAVVLVPQTFVNAEKDEVKVKGQKPLPQTPVKRYIFALNKPKGYICANSGPTQGAGRLVVDIFKNWIDREWKRDHLSGRAIPPRLFTVGRLDSQTTGLIFVTNDGPWAQSVQHPSSGLTKEYIVTTTAPYTARQLDVIAAGCEVDGAFVAPASLSLITDQRNKLRIVVSEGRNREVRRLVENAGLDVALLKRVRIGGYRMERDLGLGQYKLLKAHELRRVFDKTRQGSA